MLELICERARKWGGQEWEVVVDLKGDGRRKDSQSLLMDEGVRTSRFVDLLAVKRVHGVVQRAAALELSVVWEGFTEKCSVDDEWAVKAQKAGKSWRSTIDRRAMAKRTKYDETLMREMPPEWDAKLFTCEVGARGLVTQRVVDQLEGCARLLMGDRAAKGVARAEARALAGDVAREAVLRSYAIWVRRNTEWCDFDEVWDRKAGAERSLHELDARRQKHVKEDAELIVLHEDKIVRHYQKYNEIFHRLISGKK